MSRALILVPAALTAALLTGCSSSSGSGSGSDAAAPVAGATGTTTAAAPTTAAATPEPFAGKSAAEIYDQARAEADRAKSVHVRGTVLDGSTKIKYDLKLSKDKGGLADGTMTVAGDKITVRRLGKVVYFKAGKHFYMEQGGATNTVAKLVADRWIRTTKQDQGMKDFIALTELDGPAATGVLAVGKSDKEALKKVDGKTVDGQPTVGLYGGDSDPAESGTLYVATGAKAYPLLLDIKNGQKVTFSDWGKRVKVSAPANALSTNG